MPPYPKTLCAPLREPLRPSALKKIYPQGTKTTLLLINNQGNMTTTATPKPSAPLCVKKNLPPRDKNDTFVTQ